MLISFRQKSILLPGSNGGGLLFVLFHPQLSHTIILREIMTYKFQSLYRAPQKRSLTNTELLIKADSGLLITVHENVPEGLSCLLPMVSLATTAQLGFEL